MQKNKVSIIIPVYNVEKYLEACIQSVLNQTYGNWELLLINDGSTDTSGEICRRFADSDERIVTISQVNQGVSAARNKGLLNATGDYIAFLDSDDELEANAIEVLLQDIIQYNADIASAVKCNITSGKISHNIDIDGSVDVCDGDEMIKRSLCYDCHTRSLQPKLFSKDFLGDIIFVEGHNINEDGYFLFECYAKFPKVVQHNVSIYKYFRRENSASHSRFSEKYLDMLYFCDLKVKYISENMPAYMELARNMEVRSNLLFLDVLCRSTDRKYIDVQRKCIRTVRKFYFCHRPTNAHHKMLARIVKFGLYPIYKFLVHSKYHR